MDVADRGSKGAEGVLRTLCRALRRCRLPHSARAELALLRHEHRLLVESMQSYPMPHALYDENDRLLVWNEAYEKLYEEAFASFRQRADERRLEYADLVRHSASRSLDGEELERCVRERVAQQRDGGGNVTDREYPGVGWFRVCKHVTASGAVIGYAIDISELKRREEELVREIERRKCLESRIVRLANTDELTDVANRRHFLDRALLAFERSVRDDQALCLLMIDADHFKSVNDEFGHAAGDEVLVAIATEGASVLDGEDELFGRLGGEEFGVLLPGCDVAAGRRVAERIRRAVATRRFRKGARCFGVTLSAGVSERVASDRTPSDLLARADEALYAAKRGGRNRVEPAAARDPADALACRIGKR